ncbi:MAG TPA: HD domain-containing phosphohydrolase [Thermoanaerobaculia bacterium]|nr:HD domain-containing phosphohydrolase [Thermoanaerobaculia bacterium]
MPVAGVPAANEREVVLAVDDNEQNLQLLEEYLWQWGYDVVLARDGREALDLFPQVNPALIVLDVMMPNMDGYEACARIKATAQGRRIPIVMLTALTGTEDKIRALESGADDFLNKPINKEELRTRIRSLLKIRSLRKELDSGENIIVSLTSALGNKDPRSGGHIHRVASYSAQLCDKLKMSSDDRETIIKAALLHDVGMIGVPDQILLKGDPLTRDEEERMREHAAMGASILSPLITFRQFIPAVRWHHERADGRGYPDGLTESEIPIDAQIVGIANRFDEIRHGEVVLGLGDALDLLTGEAKRGAFSESLVEAFVAAISDEPLKRSPGPIAIPKRKPRPRVLCVDDSRYNRELVAAALADEGLEVVQAENGIEAVRRVEEEGIDVVLLDLVMPDQDGEETLSALRADPRYEFLPIIVLTAHRNSELRQQAIVAGADDFLSYPLNRLELTTRINSLLRIKDFHSDLEESQNVICALALAIEAKDSYTRGHSQRVGDLAHSFSLHLGFAPQMAELIRTAGLLHDIGKIAVPESLLNKRGPLTRDEFLRVIDHPVIGEEMCRPLLTLHGVLRMIRHHHERFDGRGYPDGLKGTAIPEEVRLLSIVDAYDALTSHRSYRPAPLDHRAALETLRREAQAGKWDPEMVDELCTMLGDEAPDYESIARPVPTLQLGVPN